jgi:hypothetical protein
MIFNVKKKKKKEGKLQWRINVNLVMMSKLLMQKYLSIENAIKMIFFLNFILFLISTHENYKKKL